jgi:hypothetical protein
MDAYMRRRFISSYVIGTLECLPPSDLPRSCRWEKLQGEEPVHVLCQEPTSLIYGCFAACNTCMTFTLGVKHERTTLPALSR